MKETLKIVQELSKLDKKEFEKEIFKTFNGKRPKIPQVLVNEFQKIQKRMKYKSLKIMLDSIFGEIKIFDREGLKEEYLKLEKKGLRSSKEAKRIALNYKRRYGISIRKDLNLGQGKINFLNKNEEEIILLLKGKYKNKTDLNKNGSKYMSAIKRSGLNVEKIISGLFGKRKKYEKNTKEYFIDKIKEEFGEKGVYNYLDSTDDFIENVSLQMNNSGFNLLDLLKEAGIKREVNFGIYKYEGNKNEVKRKLYKKADKEFKERPHSSTKIYRYYSSLFTSNGINFSEYANKRFGKALSKSDYIFDNKENFEKYIKEKYIERPLSKNLSHSEKRIIKMNYGNIKFQDFLDIVFGKRKKDLNLVFKELEKKNKEERIEFLKIFAEEKGLNTFEKIKKSGFLNTIKRYLGKQMIRGIFIKEKTYKWEKFVNKDDLKNYNTKEKKVKKLKEAMKIVSGEKRISKKDYQEKGIRSLKNKFKISSVEYNEIVNSLYGKYKFNK